MVTKCTKQFLDMGCDIRQKASNKPNKTTFCLTLWRLLRAFVFLISACALVACFSIRPVIKIGLIAPFEGLYRRTGYDALAAMRAAIADTPIVGVDILPLALDDANEPSQARRTAQKLLVDPSVQAIVGPLNPATLFSVIDVLPKANSVWVAPFAIAPDSAGFADPPLADAWATKLVGAVAEIAQMQQAHRLVLAGWTPGWPEYSAQTWTPMTKLPVVLAGNDIQAVVQDDVVFWLGSPADAAVYLAKLRAKFPNIPFWLGPQGGDPVFVERIKRHGPVYWATWLGADYTQWAAQHTPATPAAYLVYQATQQAIAAATGQPITSGIGSWRVAFFVIGEDGQSRPYAKLTSGS
ncbi:hypothetical protein BH10CHL1_BH10CHL1_30420 [soil metagenome]